MDKEIVIFAVTSAAFAGIGIVSLILNKKGRAKKTGLPMVGATIAAVVSIVVYYFVFSQLQFMVPPLWFLWIS